jgi:tetratricopeptide (TPR) repeat protein
VLARFLRALGVPGRAVPVAGEERASMYRSLIAGRRVLVVLDDAADEAQVRPLLPGTASCGVIVTSRARLGGLAGARHVELAPLPAEDGYRLLERVSGPARAASDPGSVRELVGLCAGLPLALRIAGSRLASRPHWSVGEMAGQLADERRRLDALRHRDLEIRASFALSYRGLGPRERRLFRLLGLLKAPDVARWTAAALLDTSPPEAEELLEVLADARLLEVTGPDEAGQRRYRFHDLVRIYARELATSEETASAQTAALSRAFAVLLSLCDAVRNADDGGDHAHIGGDAPRWRPAEVAAALPHIRRPMELLRAERLSLVAATRQAADLGMDEVCWELCVGPATVYQIGAYFDHWHDTHQLALATVEAAGNRRGEAVVLLFLAGYYHARRRLGRARQCADRALPLFRAIGERYGYALTLRRSSQYERHVGHFSGAIARAQEARGLLMDLGDPAAAADCLVMAGIAHLESGDAAAAERDLRQGVQEARALGSWVVAHGSYWLIQANLLLGRHREAAAAAADLAEDVRTLDDQIGAVYSRHANGSLARARGDLAAARTEWRAALNAARKIGDPLMQVRILTDLGELGQAEGRHDEAVSLLTEAVAVGRDLDFPLPRARALRRLGEVLDVGNPEGAGAAREEAAALLSEMGFPVASVPAQRS